MINTLPVRSPLVTRPMLSEGPSRWVGWGTGVGPGPSGPSCDGPVCRDKNLSDTKPGEKEKKKKAKKKENRRKIKTKKRGREREIER